MSATPTYSFTSSSPGTDSGTDVSFIMPCYNEEKIVAYTVSRFIAAFRESGNRLQLITVDNGSVDRTGAILQELAQTYPEIVLCRVPRNQGYGYGVLCGIPYCTANWIGIIPADGQVDADDVVRLYESAIASNDDVLAKVRRRFRMDGLWRRVVSVGYNVFVKILWPGLASVDVNGTPKLLRSETMRAMDLKSKGWLLDPEIMIKAHALGVRIFELNVFARLRGNGVSHVRARTCWEFLWELLAFRFSGRISRWKLSLDRKDPQLASTSSDRTTQPPCIEIRKRPRRSRGYE